MFLLTDSIYAQYETIKISDDLEVVRISKNSFIHASYYDLQSAPNYPANGLIYVNEGQAIIVDTPWTDKETKALTNWLIDSLKVNIAGVIITHWHIDCMGGLTEIHKAGIKSYSNRLTGEIAKSKALPVPEVSFRDSLTVKLADKEMICRYFGPGHTTDNIVVWIPEEKILFGGCMLKSLRWQGLGFTGDADLGEWPNTLKKLLENYSDSDVVITGHGDYGDSGIIHHTIELLKNN